MSLGSVPAASGSMRAGLERLYRAAVAAVDPGHAVRRVFGASGDGLSIAGEAVPPDSQLGVLAVGKAADCVVLDCRDRQSAVAELAPALYGFKNGRMTFKREPARLLRPD